MKAFLIIFGLIVIVIDQGFSQNTRLGAYYFDGWSEKNKVFFSKSLTDTFKLREPKWGWITSTQKVLDEQILLARDSGIDFFSFCWFYKKGEKAKSISLNNAFSLYKTSPNRNLIDYSILICNHEGFEIESDDWNTFTNELISSLVSDYEGLPKQPLYVTFFSIKSILTKFRNTENIKKAIDSLRYTFSKNSIPIPKIGICLFDTSKITLKKVGECGFDFITGYNFHSILLEGKRASIPNSSIPNNEVKIWSYFIKNTNLTFYPVSTLNWDPRPWYLINSNYKKETFFTDYSEKSVYNSTLNLLRWCFLNNCEYATLFAWNENGEGAWLTPGKLGFNPHIGVKKAIKKIRKLQR